MSTLIVRPPWAAQPAWTGTWVSAQGDAPSAAGLLSWAQAQDLPACQELLLAVPAALLSWHALTLPKLATRRWRAALDGLLEDRLLADPGELHLALSPQARGGDAVWVAACDKAWLSQALQALEQAGHPVTRIVPEFEPDGSGLHLLGPPEQGCLVDCTTEGVVCLPLGAPAEHQLRAWCEGRRPETVHAEPVWARMAESIWGQAPTLRPTGAHLHKAADSRWNLAQFDLASRHTPRAKLLRHAAQAWNAPAWRPVRWGLLGLLAVQLLGLQAWAWKEQRQLQALRDEVQAVFTRSFPQTTVVIDPVLQMEREVQALARASGRSSRSDLAPMLAAWAGMQAGTASALDFKPGELTLTGWQPEPTKLSAWQAGLQAKGYRLEPTGGQWILRAASPEARP